MPSYNFMGAMDYRCFPIEFPNPIFEVGMGLLGFQPILYRIYNLPFYNFMGAIDYRCWPVEFPCPTFKVGIGSLGFARGLMCLG